jgi:pimeloyl-ACP methyl ester carboxylesterase
MEKIKIPEIPNVKVDLIYGDKSFGAVRKSVAALQKSMPHARIHQLENAAHLPVEEATEQLCDIIFASV